jgi:predicted transcriptional regulator
MMKNRVTRFFSAALLAAMVGILVVSASAQSVTHTLNFSRPAKIGSQMIQPGKYAVAYDEKKEGELVVTKDGKEMLKAAYKLVELPNAPADSAVIFVAAGDGGYKVRRIEIKGSKTALVFE